MREVPPHVDFLLDTFDKLPYLIVGEHSKAEHWKPEYLEQYNVIAANCGAEFANTKYYCFTTYPEITKRVLDDKICIISSTVRAYGSPIDLMTLIENDLRIRDLYDRKALYSVDHSKRMLYSGKAPCAFGLNGNMILIMTLIRNGIKELNVMGLWDKETDNSMEQKELQNYCEDFGVVIKALDA